MTEILYSFLCVVCEKLDLKDIFFLHVGENTIGSDEDCDINIKLENESIDPIHAKIIVDETFTDLAIEDISISKNIFKENNGTKFLLNKRRQYELFPNKIFYLTNDLKIYIFEGTLVEMEAFLKDNELDYYIDDLRDKFQILGGKATEDSAKKSDFSNNNEGETIQHENFNDFDYVPSFNY